MTNSPYSSQHIHANASTIWGNLRLMPLAGRLLADRAREILGQVEAVREELADHPGVELALTEAEPAQALTALRHGEVDLALIFDYGDAPDDPATSPCARCCASRST